MTKKEKAISVCETKLQKASLGSEILLYQTEDGRTHLEVRFEGEAVWLSQKQLAELFQKDVRTINEHIQNIYEEGELSPEATIRKFRIVRKEGARNVTRPIDFYNLNVIIAVGYRVKSHRGTQFRVWATERLREFIVKGFTLDEERLKSSSAGNYFEAREKRMRSDSLVQSIGELAQATQHLARRAAQEYAPIVETILRTECRDIHHIEQTLDGLLDFCFDPNVPLIYKKLCRYYYDTDPTATVSYVHAYRDMWDSKSEGQV